MSKNPRLLHSLSGNWKSSNTIVAVAEQLDPEAPSVLGESVEPGEEVIEDLDELSWITPGGQGCKCGSG